VRRRREVLHEHTRAPEDGARDIGDLLFVQDSPAAYEGNRRSRAEHHRQGRQKCPTLECLEAKISLSPMQPKPPKREGKCKNFTLSSCFPSRMSWCMNRRAGVNKKEQFYVDGEKKKRKKGKARIWLGNF
jgi:hypothetical protein